MNKQNDMMRQHLNNMYKNTKQSYGYGFGGEKPQSKKVVAKKKK